MKNIIATVSDDVLCEVLHWANDVDVSNILSLCDEAEKKRILENISDGRRRKIIRSTIDYSLFLFTEYADKVSEHGYVFSGQGEDNWCCGLDDEELLPFSTELTVKKENDNKWNDW
jgi:hypothetical protein